MAAIALPGDPITGKRPRKVVTAATRTEAQRKAGELRKTLQESGGLLTKCHTDAMRRGQVARNVAELVDPHARLRQNGRHSLLMRRSAS